MAKELEAIGEVDPEAHLYEPLWVVFGQYPEAPQLLAVCLNEVAGYGVNIWGYSRYANKPAYRTIGTKLATWIIENTAPKMRPRFFNYQANALDYIRKLTEPKCEPFSRR